MICPNCNKKYNDNMLSCPKCGMVNQKEMKVYDNNIEKEKVINKLISKENLKLTKKELIITLILLTIYILTIVFNYYTFKEIEYFKYEVLKNFAFWLIIITPVALISYFNKNKTFKETVLLTSFIVFVISAVAFPFLYALTLSGYYFKLLIQLLFIELAYIILKKVSFKIFDKFKIINLITYIVFYNTVVYIFISIIIRFL